MTARPPLVRYGVAIGAFGVSLLIRILLAHLSDQTAPFIPFVSAILISAWFGGLGPGVLATVLSGIAGEWFIWHQQQPFRPLVEAVRLMMMLSFGFLMSYWEGVRHRTRDQVVTVLASITDAFCTLDHQLRFTYVNQPAAKMLGRPAGALIGQPLDDSARILPGCPDRCWEALGTGQPVEWEAQIEASETWIHGKAYPSSDGLSLLLHDITGKKQAEQRARQTSEMLTALVRASPLPIMAVTPTGEVTLWNAAAQMVFGWTEAEVIGGPIPFIPAEKLAEHRAMRAQDLAGAGFASREVRRQRKDGSAVDLSVSTAPMRDEDGRIQGIMSVYVDITERKRAEEALRHSEAQLRLITDALPVLIAYIDANLRYRFVNRAYLEWWGRSAEETIGRTVQELVPPEIYEGIQDRLQAALRGETVVFEWSATQPNGMPFISRVTFVPDHAEPPGRGGFLAVVEDITKLKQDELALREMNQKLQRANDDLHQFAYAASHDLQEPLRAVISYSQLLERQYRDQLDDRAREFMEYIVGSARRVVGMLRALRHYWQAGESDSPPSPVSCAEALEQVLLNLEVAIESSEAKITYEWLPTVLAHDVALVQLWQNLISNAIKYHGEEPPRVHIRAEQQQDGWLFIVDDNGIGIEPENRQRIFRLFKRLHGSEYSGTGIGLAMCSKIVERYGGRIWAEPNPAGKGTSFRFTLPFPVVLATMQHGPQSSR